MKENAVDWVSQQVPNGRDWLEYMMVGPGSTVPADRVDARELGVLNHVSLGVAMTAHILVEEEVLQGLAEGRIVRDPLVQVEIGFDDLLDHVFDLVVEGEPHVLPRVDARRGFERRVVVKLLHHMGERYAVLRTEIEPEAFV